MRKMFVHFWMDILLDTEDYALEGMAWWKCYNGAFDQFDSSAKMIECILAYVQLIGSVLQLQSMASRRFHRIYITKKSCHHCLATA